MKPKTKLTGHIVVPGDPLYNSARTEFNIRFSKFPGVIVFCLKVQDVINGVKWARERGVPLRVRSGRHSYEGFSTVNGGIVIDVSPLNKVQVDRRKGIAKVGAGADLEHLYKELWRRGVTIPGGTCPTVGIAGLTLGGGIGFLSRLLGLTCDRLLAVDMVIASGKQDAKLIHIDRKNNSDLFWASCGGGGGNFGIATSFTFKVHPISNVSIYRIAWNWNDIREVLKAWQQWAPFVDRRLTSTIQLGAKQSGTVTSMGQFVGPVTQLRRLIQPLLKAGTPIKVEILTVPFIKAVEIFSNLDPRHPHDFENTGVFVNRPLPDQAIQTICFFLQNAPNKNAGVGGMGLAAQPHIFTEKQSLLYRSLLAGKMTEKQRKISVGRIVFVKHCNLLRPETMLTGRILLSKTGRVPTMVTTIIDCRRLRKNMILLMYSVFLKVFVLRES